MTEPTPTPVSTAPRTGGAPRPASKGKRPRRRHPAQGARIAAAGLGATTMLGIVGAMGYNARPAPVPAAAPTPAPATQPQVVVVVHRADGSDPVSTTVVTPPAPAAETTLTARPTVRSAAPQPQAPAASTSGSN